MFAWARLGPIASWIGGKKTHYVASSNPTCVCQATFTAWPGTMRRWPAAEACPGAFSIWSNNPLLI